MVVRQQTQIFLFFFLNDPPTTEISPLPLHAPLPISAPLSVAGQTQDAKKQTAPSSPPAASPRLQKIVDDAARAALERFKEKGLAEKNLAVTRSEEHTSELQSQSNLVCRLLLEKKNKT